MIFHSYVIYQRASACGALPDAHSFAACASTCCSPLPASTCWRYCDSPPLKELCRSGSLTCDSAERRCLSLQIHRMRAVEKKAWKRSLLVSSAHGDWAARRSLTKHASRRAEFAARGLVTRHGSRESAAASIQAHFQARLGSCTAHPRTLQS